MATTLQSAVQRALCAWDTTTLKTNGDGMLSEAMEVLRAEFGGAIQAPEGAQLPNVVKTAPAKIYLVIGEDCPPEEDFKRLASAAGEDLTWCEDKIDANSIEYIRADLAAHPASALAAADEKLVQMVRRDWPNAAPHRGAVLAAANEVDVALAAQRTQTPAEGDELTTGRQYLLTPEYGAAMVEMAKHYDMSVDNVLRAAIRLYQAQRFGSIKIEHVRDSKLFDLDVQPKGTWVGISLSERLDNLTHAAQWDKDEVALLKANLIRDIERYAQSPAPAHPQLWRDGGPKALDPNKCQLCRVGVHSADALARDQNCDCQPGTCRMWNGGLRPAQAPAVGAAPAEWRKAVQEAYGWLWHINNEPMAPVPLLSEGKAAYQARKALRDLLTSAERGEAINAVTDTIDNMAVDQPPVQGSQP